MILAITRRAISVVERFQHFRAQRITAIRYVESRALVERRLVSWYLAGIPREGLGTNAGQSLIVSVLTAGDEFEAKVDVLLFFEDEATKNEVPAIEAGEVARSKDQSGVIEGG